MFNLFKSKKQEVNLIYPEVVASKRIDKIIENFILPKIEYLGFKLMKSELKLVRNVGDFRQTIYVQKSRTNDANVSIRFNLVFIVEYITYKKWFRNRYNVKLPNDYRINDNVLWATHDDVPNWGETLYSEGWYDLLAKDNYEIVNEINDKLIRIAIPYMEQFSDLENAIDNNIILERYTKTAMMLDFCEILNNDTKAAQIINWFNLSTIKNGIHLKEEVVYQINERIKFHENRV